MTPDQAVRILRAKAAELESMSTMRSDLIDHNSLAATLALVAQLLAYHIEATSPRGLP